MPRRYLIFAAAAALTGVCVHMMKFAVERQRPYTFFLEDFLAEKVRINCLFKTYVAQNSFPSGHAALVFVTAVILHRLYGKRLWVLYPLAFLIAFSRIYVGAHFPSDVLAGALIGIVVGLIFSKKVLWKSV